MIFLLKILNRKIIYIFILQIFLSLIFSNKSISNEKNFSIYNINISEKFDHKFSKDKVIEKADRLEDDELMDVSIYVFNKNNENISRLEAKKADIKNKIWLLSDVKVFNKYINANAESNFSKSYLFETNINVKNIKNLFSKLETVSFWKLNKVKSNYKDIGYSTEQIDLEFQKGISYPFFIMAMTFLACIIMLHTKYKVNTLYHVIFGLFISVVIFYLNDLSKVLGQTEKISLIQSVWMPIVIIFILGIVGSMQISDK